MSLAVLRRKANEKTKLNMQNRYAGQRGQPFALNMVGRGKVRSNPVMGMVNNNRCCPPTGFANVSDDKKVSRQTSYYNYNKRSLKGLGRLASRVVTISDPSVVNSPDQMVTHKREPKVASSQHIKDIKLKEIRCDNRVVHCDPNAVPPFSQPNPNLIPPSGSSFLPSYLPATCNNNCGKGKATITKDLRFMSSSDYLKKKLSYRKMTGNYEEPLMNNSSSRC